MSEPVAKERPSVDLDDFERRLDYSDHNHQRGQHGEDPLAQLARLVGEQQDPYGDVFAQEASIHESHGRREPAFGGGVSPRLSGDFAAIEAGLRGPISAHGEPAMHAAPHDQDLYAEQHPQHEQAYLRDHEAQQWDVAPQQQMSAPRSRRPIYAIAASIAVGVIGIGGAFAYKGTSSSPREIKTIAAASGPTKIQPPVEASADQGAPDSSMLGKGQQAQPTKLVSREEQPVELSQAVQENNSRDADAGAAPGDASSVPVPPAPSQQANETAAPAPGPSIADLSGFAAGMPSPKRVKVVSVRPDGTILPNDAPPAAALPASRPAMGKANDKAAAVAKPSTPKTAASPKTTSRVAAAKPVQVASADTTADDATPAAKPARKAKPQRVASAEPTADTEATASVPASKGGGFAVQLAAPGSESDAKAASSRFSKKFAAALAGRRLGFHKADSNGKSVYRVRVGSLSKDEAVSLCGKLKADGGSCFVAKN